MKIPTKLLFRCSGGKSVFGVEFSQVRTLSTVDYSPVSPEALNAAKPFDEIPGPKPFPFFGNLHRYLPVIGEYSIRQWYEANKIKFEKYGSIVREKIMPGVNIIYAFDPKDMEMIHQYEGKYPQRDFLVSLRTIRERNRKVYSSVGLAAGNGEEWFNLRRRSQQPMMRPQLIKTYLPQINFISDDFIRRMRMLKQSDQQVPEFMNELFKWALESIIYILFNQRMGCLDDNLTPDSVAQQYILIINKFFKLSGKAELSLIPLWRLAPSLSPTFWRLKKAHDFFFNNAMKYAKAQLCKMEGGCMPEEESLMQTLLETCSPGDACVMAVDAMAAGIDTTALSLAYILRNLAANPEVQQKLQEEVDRVVPDKKPLTVKALDSMSYLRACVKESMRISPTVQGTTRTLDKDIVLSGYRVPAGNQIQLNYYISSVQEKYFPDAAKYKPERWLRTGTGEVLHSFAFQPFGFGPRMCVGRRVAELEMLTLLTKIMQNFWIENKSRELDINFQLVLMIKSPLQYEFHERRK